MFYLILRLKMGECKAKAHVHLVPKFKICGCLYFTSIQFLATRNSTQQLLYLLTNYVTYVELTVITYFKNVYIFK
jgi:hypothetical protein